MSLDIKYYNTKVLPTYILESGRTGTEVTGGNVYYDEHTLTFGQKTGRETTHSMIRFPLSESEAIELSGRRILPQSYLSLQSVEHDLVPWSGRIYCELASSSVPIDTTVSGISTRNKTDAFFEIDFIDSSGSYYNLNDRVISYWKMNEESGTRYDSLSSNNLTETGSVDWDYGRHHQCASGLAAGNSLQNNSVDVPFADHDFSLDFWFRPDNSGVDLQNTELVFVGDGPADEGLHINVACSSYPNYQINFQYYSESYTVSTVNSGQWQHIAASVEAFGPEGDPLLSGVATLYYGNNSLSTNAQASTRQSDTVRIGTVGNTSFSIDELGLYSGTYDSTDKQNRESSVMTYPMQQARLLRWGYKNFGPVQELVDTYGSSLREIAFIYEHSEGSGYTDLRTYSSGITNANYLIHTEKVGGDIDDPIDSGLLVYWNMESQYDKINNLPLYFTATRISEYGHYNSGFLSFGNDLESNGSLWTGNTAKHGTVRTEQDFIRSSSVHPTGNFAVLYWASAHSEQGGQVDQSLIFSKDTDWESSQVAFRGTVAQDGEYGRSSGLFTAEVKDVATNQTREWHENTRWNYYYLGLNDGVLEHSINAGPKTQLSGIGELTPNSGFYNITAAYCLLDEIRVYNRSLSDRDLEQLYNRGFPIGVNQPSPKREYLYPQSDAYTAAGNVFISYRDYEFGEDLRTSPSLDFTSYAHDDTVHPGTLFSTVNEWYGPHSGISPKDYSCFALDGAVSETIKFNMGPCHVKPSSVTLHVKGKTTTYDYNMPEVSSGLPVAIFGIDYIKFKDNRGQELFNSDTLNSGYLQIEYSGNYSGGNLDNYVHHMSGFEVTADGADLSNTTLEFRLNNGVDHWTQIHSVSLELNGAVNIAQTGLTLYTDGVYGINSGIDLYTTAIDSRNSGIDLYSIGSQAENSSIPLYAVSAESMNSGIDLYSYGVDTTNSGIDLFTWGISSDNSGMDLYTRGLGVLNSGMDLFTWGISSDNSGIDLYTHGALIVNSGMDLYSYGRSSDNSGMELFTEGFLTLNSGIDLYMSGIGRPTSSLDLMMWGRDTHNSGMELMTWGHLSNNSGMTLWTEGVEYSSGGMPFFLEATLSYGSGGFPLYINSTTETSTYKARPMYLEVNDNATDTGSMPLFLNSVTAGSGDQYMPFYLESRADSLTKGTDMYLKNAFESGFKSQFLYVKGLGTLDGGSVGNGSMPLFIERTEGAENGMSMYLGVNSGDNKGVNMYTYGGTWSNSGVDLVIPSTIDSKNSGINVYINGF